MSSLDLLGIDKILSYWANRPKVARTGKPASVHTCREQIKIFRRFLRLGKPGGVVGATERLHRDPGSHSDPARRT